MHISVSQTPKITSKWAQKLKILSLQWYKTKKLGVLLDKSLKLSVFYPKKSSNTNFFSCLRTRIVHFLEWTSRLKPKPIKELEYIIAEYQMCFYWPRFKRPLSWSLSLSLPLLPSARRAGGRPHTHLQAEAVQEGQELWYMQAGHHQGGPHLQRWVSAGTSEVRASDLFQRGALHSWTCSQSSFHSHMFQVWSS